jgi:vacuolar-type H+-ATPase subunit F/Vma7
MTEPTRQFKKLRPVLGLALCVLVGLCPYETKAQASAETEQNIKAGFIYNFALFTQWPAKVFKDGAAPLALCIAGDRATVQAFELLTKKKVLDRPVTVCAFGDNATSHPCHIIYIDSKNKTEAADLLRRVSGPGVLTIGDLDGFCRLGGIINFYRGGKKLRFEINTDAAERAELKFSSRLLKLATIVREEKP